MIFRKRVLVVSLNTSVFFAMKMMVRLPRGVTTPGDVLRHPVEAVEEHRGAPRGGVPCHLRRIGMRIGKLGRIWDDLGWWCLEDLPSGNLTSPWKLTIYGDVSHQTWWFSMAMLNYQRVNDVKTKRVFPAPVIHRMDDAYCEALSPWDPTWTWCPHSFGMSVLDMNSDLFMIYKYIFGISIHVQWVKQILAVKFSRRHRIGN